MHSTDKRNKTQTIRHTIQKINERNITIKYEKRANFQMENNEKLQQQQNRNQVKLINYLFILLCGCVLCELLSLSTSQFYTFQMQKTYTLQ